MPAVAATATAALLSTEPEVLIPAVVREHERREGCLKRGLHAAAQQMVCSVSTVRALLYGWRKPGPRLRWAAQWAGLTLAQERVDQLQAEIEDFNRLVGDVERALTDMALAAPPVVARARDDHRARVQARRAVRRAVQEPGTGGARPDSDAGAPVAA